MKWFKMINKLTYNNKRIAIGKIVRQTTFSNIVGNHSRRRSNLNSKSRIQFNEIQSASY